MADQPVRHVGTTALVDLLDRVIDAGVVVSGDVILSLAGIDLVQVDLRILIAPVERLLAEQQR